MVAVSKVMTWFVARSVSWYSVRSERCTTHIVLIMRQAVTRGSHRDSSGRMGAHVLV